MTGGAEAGHRGQDIQPGAGHQSGRHGLQGRPNQGENEMTLKSSDLSKVEL